MIGTNELNDEELVRYAQQGAFDCFTSLYDRYFSFVYRRVKYSIPQEDVEDVTQEVFIAVVRSLKDFRGESKFKTWLCSLISRKIADYYRHRDLADFQLKEDCDDEEDDQAFVEAESSEKMDESIVVRQAISSLPQKYQEVIMMRFADDLPFAKIAEKQGQTLEATKSLFRRAISMLKKILEETHA